MRYSAFLLAALLASTNAHLCDEFGNFLNPICVGGAQQWKTLSEVRALIGTAGVTVGLCGASSVQVCHNGNVEVSLAPTAAAAHLTSLGSGHEHDRILGAKDASGALYSCSATCDEDEDEYDASPSPSPAAPPATPPPTCAEEHGCGTCGCCWKRQVGQIVEKQLAASSPGADWTWYSCETNIGGLCLGQCPNPDVPDTTPPPEPCKPECSVAGEILDTFCPNLDILYSCGICYVDEVICKDDHCNTTYQNQIVTNVCPGHNPEEIEDYCSRENFNCGAVGGAVP